MIEHLFKEIKEPYQFIKRAWMALRHPKELADAMAAQEPSKRRAEVVALVLGSIATNALIILVLQSFFELSEEFSISEKFLLITWTVLAFLLHIGVTAMFVPGRSYGKTLEISGVWFAMSLFGLGLWFFILFAGASLLRAAISVDCAENDFQCLASELGSLNLELLSALMKAWLSATSGGLLLLAFASLAYAALIMGRWYGIHILRSAAAVVLAYVIVLFSLALFIGAAAPTELRDSVIVLNSVGAVPLDLRTVEERNYTGPPPTAEELEAEHQQNVRLCKILSTPFGLETDPETIKQKTEECVRDVESEPPIESEVPDSGPSHLAQIINRIFVLLGADVSPTRTLAAFQ